MSIWDEIEEIEEEVAEDKNKYLADPEEGLNLMAKILAFNKGTSKIIRNLIEFNNLIEGDFLKFSSQVSMEKEAEIYRRLLHIKDRLSEVKKIKLLDGKHIVGLGGQFSAGKSKFINSILGEDILPEDQVPTTSIPTYIARGEDKLSAHTFNNIEIHIDKEAVEALCHAFYEEYGLSFSHVIRNIVIQNKEQRYRNIVFLDTPGYTKSDSYKKKDNTDEYTAQEHLRMADYIIWLIDIENGTITHRDLDFITNLGVSTPILFVFNKGDKVPMDTAIEIVEESKKEIKNKGINIYGVTAYSSRDKIEFTGNYIEDFLIWIEGLSIKKNDIKEELNRLLKMYEIYFEENKNNLHNRKRLLKGLINRSYNLSQLLTLARMFSDTNSQIILNNIRKKEFDKLSEKISRQLKTILNLI